MKRNKAPEIFSDAMNNASTGDLNSIGKIGCLPITILILLVIIIYIISR